MIVIEPHKNSCNVWWCNRLQVLKGSPENCCYGIIRWISKNNIKEEIILDRYGVGEVYATKFSQYKIPYREVLIGIDGLYLESIV